jgi:hypothetical protein
MVIAPGLIHVRDQIQSPSRAGFRSPAHRLVDAAH